MRERFPSEDQDRFMVRLPDGMRAKIRDAAKAHNRNMNGEIIARLEASFAEAEGGDLAAISASAGDLEQRVSALERAMLAVIADERGEPLEKRVQAFEDKSK